ncbi:MAG: septal ring lytic transglycosylase RlpA family protein [Thermodesulfobacteriota bacterium]
MIYENFSGKNPDPDHQHLKPVDRFISRCCRIAAACVFLLALGYGCATVEPPAPPPPPGYPKPYKVLGKWYQPLPHAKDFSQRGIASWYGEDFHGKKTSSGEVYDMHAMTAAHKTLPLGTYVQVTNLSNNKATQVRINDRGPFVRDRIIDLSYSAARKLEVVGPGTAPVEIVALGTMVTPESAGKPGGTYLPVDYYSGNFTIQVGAFADRSNAERLKNKLDQKFKNAHITVYDTGKEIFYRVRVGRCTTLQQADEYEAIMISEGYKDAFAVAEDQ